MTVFEIISELRKFQVFLKLDNANLKLGGNTSALSAELLAEIKNNKEDIIHFLKESQHSLELETIAKAEVKEYYPLSNAQRRLWLLSQFDGGNQAYNITTDLYLQGDVLVKKLEEAFLLSIAKHESLRTVFTIIDDEPVQKILPSIPFQFEQLDLSTIPYKKQQVKEEIENAKNYAFDLEKGPLLKVKLIRLSEQELAMIFSLHHIISDGWSIGVLVQEIMNNYKQLCLGGEIVIEKDLLQYKDFSVWLSSKIYGDRGNSALQYWKNKSLGEISALNLPTDFKRPDSNLFEGAIQKFYFDNLFHQSIEQLAKKNKVTIFNVYRACLSLLFHKLSGQTELIIGTPVSGRMHSQLHSQIGLYVNTLPLVSKLNSTLSFSEYLKEISTDSLSSFEYQDYPLDLIIENSNVTRDTTRNPLFDVMMVLQNTAIGDGSIDVVNQHGFKLHQLDKYLYETDIVERVDVPAKFDLSFNFASDPHKGYYLEIEYRTKLFKKNTIQSFYNSFQYIIKQVVFDETLLLNDVQLIDESEKNKILQEFNQPIETVIENNILDLLNDSFQDKKNEIALLVDDKTFTYAQVDAFAQSVASAIQTILENKQTEKIGMLLERSEHLLFSVLGILKSQNTYVPVDVTYPEDRINYILEDSNVSVLIVDEIGKTKIPTNFSGKIIDVKEIAEQKFINTKSSNKEDTAYLIYTSGSTGKPKGVEISHKNAIAFLKWSEQEFKQTPYQLLYAATSYCFDLSVFEMFLPLIQGKKIRILKSALEIIQHLDKGQDKNIFINTVPSVVRNLLDQQISWKNVIALNMAGEPVPVIFKDLLDYKNIEIRNLYGPSEDTTYSTMYRFEDGNHDSIPIGKPVGYTQLYILDQASNLMPVGVEGEICLSGLSVAKGYLNKPELTAEKFIKNPFVEGQSMYKTGDIGKWLPDGKVAYIGRMDDQVKVRGYRIELGEIQYRIEQINEVEQAIVIVKEIHGENTIVAYWKSVKKLEQQKVEDYLKIHLPNYMLPTYYIELDEIPLNSNGKVDKKKLPSLTTITKNTEIVLPSTDLQYQLFAIWTEVLNRNDFGIKDNFFELGGHSLKATKLRGIIAREIGKELTINEIFQNSTIESQTIVLEQKGKKEIQLIERNDSQEFYPVSFTQERLWVLTNFEEASKAYHMPAAFVVKGNLDVARLESALNMVVEKHESLRTVFKEVNGQPVQLILDSKSVFIKVEQIQKTGNEIEIENFLKTEWQTPFDLQKGPLLRCFVLNTNDKMILSFNMHHIISDGWSIGVLYQDVMKAYTYLSNNERTSLLPLEIQFKDYAVWQRNHLTNEVLQEQLAYWKNTVFQKGVSVLELPTNFHRPEVKTYNGSTITHTFSKELSKKIATSNLKHGASLFMTVMANVSILLKKLANQSDITIGTPVAGRDSAQLQNQIGFFVNTLPIRVDVLGNFSYKEFLANERSTILKSFDYQYFPFELLVHELQPKRDLSRSPLFDVMVVLQNMDILEGSGSEFYEDIHLEKLEMSGGITKYDLTFSFSEYENQIHLELEFNTDLYNKETISHYINYLETIFEITSVNETILIKDINLIEAEEQKQILLKADKTGITYNKEETIVSLFEKAVNNYPKNIALKVGEKEFTYEELDQKSGQLARVLIEKYNVKIEDLIVLHTHRTEWMLIAVLAVLKAGAAYVPIDPAYPSSRINYILKDSESKLILSDSDLSSEITNLLPENVTCLNIEKNSCEGKTLTANVQANNLAYVIYTSGTTGNPKGVLIEHRNVNRLLFNDKDLFDFNSNDRWSLFHSYCFDFSVWEMYGAILKGGTLVMVSKEVAQDSMAFYDFLKEEKITVLNQTPTAFRSLSLVNNKRFKTEDLLVRYVIFGGEALMPEILEPWNKSFPACKLINMYGITETTVHVTYKEITNQDIQNNKSIIGEPIPTLSCYVLDQDLKPVTIGVVGELCVGGAGVARGYHNRIELTQEKFIDNPFKPDEKIYRSGDFARILENGNIEYIGRKDEQVKIRGHRIEIGEIEAALVKLDQIEDAVVLTTKTAQGEYELIAYIIINENDSNDVKQIRDILLERLPSYMIPSYFIELKEFPLTSNGKLDKKALPLPSESSASKTVFTPARNKVDESIVKIWILVLERENIGIKDNFFDLGGHSLKATRVLSKIHEEFGIKIDLKNLFIDPTVEHLSNYIETMQWMESKNDEVNVEQEEMIL